MTEKVRSRLTFTSVMNNDEKITLTATPKMVEHIIIMCIGDDAADSVTDIVEEGISSLKKQIDKYNEERKSLTSFKARLSNLVSS